MRTLMGIAVACLPLPPATAQPAADAPVDFRLRRVTKLPALLQMHGSAVVGNRLYVFGGHIEHEGWTDKAWSSPIDGSGELGAWRREAGMPDRRSYFASSVAVVQDRIYVVGGNVMPAGNSPGDQNQRARNVAWTRVQANGELGGWSTSETYPGNPVSSAAACASDRALYVVGGITTGNAPTQNVYVGRFANDGTLGQWASGTPLPVPLWFHGVSLQEDRVYVWGGLTKSGSDSPNSQVFSAPVGADDSVGAWRDETAMPNGMYSSAFLGANEYLISLGGRYKNGFPTRSIWFAQLKNGAVEDWKMMRSDLEGTVYAAAALDKVRGVVYLTGGRHRLGLELDSPILDTVQAFRLDQPAEKRLPALASVVERTAPEPPGPFNCSQPETYPPVAQALGTAKSSGKDVLVVFYSPEVPGCRKMRDGVLANPAFETIAGDYCMAAADVSGRDAALTYEYSVFRVPTMVLLSADNAVLKRSGPLASVEDVKAFLQSRP